jgi:hypothetical protein
MPPWAQYIIGASLLVPAAGVLWARLLRPLIRLHSDMEEAVPVMRDLVEQLGGTPDVFDVLAEIASQFRTDSGSSLRDVVNRLEEAAVESKRANEVLTTNVAVVKELSALDREQLSRLLRTLDRLEDKMGESAASMLRMEADRDITAADDAGSTEQQDQR